MLELALCVVVGEDVRRSVMVLRKSLVGFGIEDEEDVKGLFCALPTEGAFVAVLVVFAEEDVREKGGFGWVDCDCGCCCC